MSDLCALPRCDGEDGGASTELQTACTHTHANFPLRESAGTSLQHLSPSDNNNGLHAVMHARPLDARAASDPYSVLMSSNGHYSCGFSPSVPYSKDSSCLQDDESRLCNCML